MIRKFAKFSNLIIPGLAIFIFIAGCVGSKKGSATKNEALTMQIKEKRDVVKFDTLKNQETPTLVTRGQGKARGIGVTPIVGTVVSLATNAIKKVISDEKKKYSAAYQFALTDLYFYDQLSTEGPFDPVGMQFSGFKLVRTFINKNGEIDTAFTANIGLDKSNPYEILNNSVFRLRLDDLDLRYTKAKVSASGKKTVNMDIEITFRSSYVNQQAVLFDNVALGKFYIFLRDAPLDTAAANYKSYYENLKGSMLTGRSFLVPRSFGYHMEDGQPVSGYSQGAYTITVEVKESTKNFFVTKVISENTNIIDLYKDKALQYIDQKLPSSLH